MKNEKFTSTCQLDYSIIIACNMSFYIIKRKTIMPINMDSIINVAIRYTCYFVRSKKLNSQGQ